MSDQSPWGAPPPSYGSPGPNSPTPSTPTPPPTGSTPPYPQPGYGGGWSGPPSYGGGPGGPGGPGGSGRPGGRRVLVVVGAVVALLLVVAAFVVTLAVTSDEEPDESATDTATPTETGGSGDGGEVEGDGYSFSLPAPGWSDQTDNASELGDVGTLDTIIVLGSSIRLAQSNIIVEALDAGTASSPDDLEGLWKRNLASTDNATPVDIDDTTIDGERAIGVRIDDRVNNVGEPIKQMAYLVLHDGMQYSIALSYPASGDTVSEGDLRTVLADWQWSE